MVGNTRLADLKKQLKLQAAHAQQLAAAEAGSRKEALDDGKVGCLAAQTRPDALQRLRVEVCA